MNSSRKTSRYDGETYERIAKAIAFMRQNYFSQPHLAEIAQSVHLSEYHFQRLFTQWVGISPKRFLQYLTVEYAKAKIAETTNLLDLTVEVGLSSPGRLHDLFVKLEAMSPGEFQRRGMGLRIDYGIHPTPFGECLIAKTSRGICNLYFLDPTTKALTAEAFRWEWEKADLREDPEGTELICDRIFNPAVYNHQPLVLHVKGTNFQIQVWRALLSIPPGKITTYQRLAAATGYPTAARAVGNALGGNPVAYLIPCHRVIRASGEWGGFRWGGERKMMMLGWEASQDQNRNKTFTAGEY